MTTIELTKDQDLSVVEEGLNKMGLEFHVDEVSDDDEWGDLPESVIESIKAGLADSEAGRLIPHEEVMARMAKRLADEKWLIISSGMIEHRMNMKTYMNIR